MQKQVILFVIVFFFGILIVDAAPVTNKYMIAGENVTLNGKLIVFLYPIQNGYAIFSVDGVWVKVPLNKTVSGNGADITMNEADSNYAIVTIEVDFVCGDGVCNGAEAGGGSCCKDCGCLSGFSCVDNRCVISSSNVCVSDSDCADKNPCTKDICGGAPRRCINDLITLCTNGDGCCLSNCNIYTDSDCKSSCSYDSQCNDNNPCTQDKCSSGTCSNTDLGGCNVDGACLPNATSTQGSYCLNSVMAAQRKSSEACKVDAQCISYDCRGGRCRGDAPSTQSKNKNTGSPIGKFFAENNHAYLYIILAFALFVIIIEIKKYIKDKKEGF